MKISDQLSPDDVAQLRDLVADQVEPAGPRRVQMSRQHPWREQYPDAVIVDRRTVWGNPFPVSVHGRDEALRLYREHLDQHPELVERARRELHGRDLACWCGADEACHADVLLEVANS